MNDHVVLSINGRVVYESDIGTKPPEPTPTPTPVPIPVPIPVHPPGPIQPSPIDPFPLPPTPTPIPSRTVPYNFFRGETRAGLEYKFKNGYAKMPEGWSWEEFEASGFMAEEEAVKPAETQWTGNVISGKGHPYRVDLNKGEEHRFSVPTTAGEDVTLILLEVAGTPDSLTTNSYVTDERGRLLAGPSYFGRHGSHTFKAQSNQSFLSITPTDSGPLGIQRR